MTFTACDYSAPEGGTLDVRLTSTSSALSLTKAEVTIEHVSIASNYEDSDPERFEGWPNMIDNDLKLDLTELEGAKDVRLARDQIPHGDFDGLHVKLSETAEITYQDENGDSVETTASLPKDLRGNVALTFDSMVLSENEEATVSLRFDLGSSFDKKKEKAAFKFQPSISIEEMIVNGDKRALSKRTETDTKRISHLAAGTDFHLPQLRFAPPSAVSSFSGH